ncbi:hypothetical protein WJU16_18115 [Chitinophaga pollutisoli]|uniref:Uncharacterized protein n=1 Tax=Chitinophaga pollutisoli TaxID=3133966 RepID=A0ABZ2YJJ9_9BACT
MRWHVTMLPISDSATRIVIQKSTNGTFEAIKCESSTDSFPKGFVYFTLTPKGNQIRSEKRRCIVSTDFPAKQTGNLFSPYLMTNPIVQHPALLRVSPDNLKHKLPELEYFVKNPIDAEYKKISPIRCWTPIKKLMPNYPQQKRFSIRSPLLPSRSTLKQNSPGRWL